MASLTLSIGAVLAAASALVSPAPTSVHIVGFAFAPDRVTIAAGDSVRFVNDDDVPHTVTAIDGAFDSKIMTTGVSWQHVFAKPGTYKYFCTVHPYMKATIIVSATPSPTPTAAATATSTVTASAALISINL